QPALEVRIDLHLAPRVVAAHVTDLAVDRPFGAPSPVEASKAPEDAAVRVRVATIDGVLVVQLDQGLQGLLRRLAPLEHLLAPEHAQVVVDSARLSELPLRCVP